MANAVEQAATPRLAPFGWSRLSPLSSAKPRDTFQLLMLCRMFWPLTL
jgi:hypothetical protein